MKKGKLYVVATPIGNLEDITLRALEVLKKVPFILAEDTRESKKLLNKYKIETHLVSYRDQNHERMMEKILEKLNMGLDLALVSDNGTPLISDPGYKLVRELRELGYEIMTVPGPSALTSAISISGLPSDKVSFLGFLPKSDSKREDVLNTYLETDSTLVVYESPNRLFKLLELVLDINNELNVCAIRDMTKIHEKVYYGKVKDVLDKLQVDDLKENPYGEWVILISKKV
jgi:16S rRNA (cytidine1402-2'-O)-methyltransferase